MLFALDGIGQRGFAFKPRVLLLRIEEFPQAFGHRGTVAKARMFANVRSDDERLAPAKRRKRASPARASARKVDGDAGFSQRLGFIQEFVMNHIGT